MTQNTLRDYQAEICEKVSEAFGAHRSVMMQMPTGTGKTVVLASLVGRHLQAEARCPVLIVAHRIELTNQAGTLLSRFGMDYGVIARGRKPRGMKPVMVASVQTLSAHLHDISAALTPSFVIIDEAHHALAKTYRQLWTAWPEAKFLGLTATPYRMSGEGFTDLFEVLVESRSIRQFIADGWLSPYDYYSIRPDSEQQREIDSLKKRGADGDFQMRELREKLDVRPSIERLFSSFGRFAFDKKGIIYSIDIAHAEHIAEFYRQQGVNAVAISSKTPAKERESMIRGFKSQGFLQILVSVDLFSEGFDCPDVEFIQLARPTLSLTKYLQMVGRGLRPCKGKTCCTIIDNVGLYRTFGLPSVDRDWGAYFTGNENLGIRNQELANGSEQFLWLGCGDLLEENDADIVKIISHEGMQSQFANQGSTGFERRKKGKEWIWTDLTNGVEFGHHPQVINYRGIELSTADGETYFPRIRSRWIDAKHGINRKALETQVGQPTNEREESGACSGYPERGGRQSQGIGWMRLYVPFAMPGKVLQLQSVKPNQMRIYKDEHGKVFLQQDLDHAPIGEEEAGGRKAFMARCDKEQEAWEETKRNIRKRTLKYDAKKRWWQIPEGSIKQPWNGKHGSSIYHIIYKEGGESKEMWVDETSGFTYRHRPVLRKRGFVELLYDGDVVYIQNIREERFMPYRNWEIRADERICAIGNKLYFCKEKDEHSYRIRKRSDDFRMFIVEDKIEHDELLIINKAGKELEITKANCLPFSDFRQHFPLHSNHIEGAE